MVGSVLLADQLPARLRQPLAGAGARCRALRARAGWRAGSSSPGVATAALGWMRRLGPAARRRDATAALGLALVFVGALVRSGGGGSGVARAGIEVMDAGIRIGSNVVSFTRLAAFGLTHAALSLVTLQGASCLAGSVGGGVDRGRARLRAGHRDRPRARGAGGGHPGAAPRVLRALLPRLRGGRAGPSLPSISRSAPRRPRHEHLADRAPGARARRRRGARAPPSDPAGAARAGRRRDAPDGDRPAPRPAPRAGPRGGGARPRPGPGRGPPGSPPIGAPPSSPPPSPSRARRSAPPARWPTPAPRHSRR